MLESKYFWYQSTLNRKIFIARKSTLGKKSEKSHQDYKNSLPMKIWKEKFWLWPTWNQDLWLVSIQTVWLFAPQHQTTLKLSCWFLTDKLGKEYFWMDMKDYSHKVIFYQFWIQREKSFKNVFNTSKQMLKDMLFGKVSD